MDYQELQRKVETLEKDLQALNSEYYANNFSAQQDFNKKSSFTTRLKVPHYDTLPTTCEIGEIAETAGKLRVCSALNTWSIVGSQS